MYALLTIVRHLHGHVAGVRRDVEQPGICAHKQVLLAVLLHDSLDVEHGLLERNQMRGQRFNDNFIFLRKGLEILSWKLVGIFTVFTDLLDFPLKKILS